jgi:hypothetical protein
VRQILARPNQAGQTSAAHSRPEVEPHPSGHSGSRLDWLIVFDPIDTTRPIEPYVLVRTMCLALALKFGTAWRLDGKAVRP